MNIEVNSTLVYFLFAYIPIVFVCYIIVKKSLENEQETKNKLLMEIQNIFDKFEQKNTELSKEDAEIYNILRKTKDEYNNITENIYIHFILAKIILFGTKKKDSKDDYLIKNENLKILEESLNALILIGILKQNKLLGKMFYWKNYKLIRNMEIEMFADEIEILEDKKKITEENKIEFRKIGKYATAIFS